MEAMSGLPTTTIPPGLGRWIDRMRQLIVKQRAQGDTVSAVVVDTEPRQYDDQSWTKAMSKAWQRNDDEGQTVRRECRTLGGILYTGDYTELKRAIARAANLLGERSWRYALDVGEHHAVLYQGSEQWCRPILACTGPTMAETKRYPTVVAALATLSATLKIGESVTFNQDSMGPGMLLPPQLMEKAAAAAYTGKPMPIVLVATRLRDGATALQAPQVKNDGTLSFGHILALHATGEPIAAATMDDLPMFAASRGR